MSYNVIGSSGHGRDIASTLHEPRVWDHHKDWDGSRPYVIGINDPQLRYTVNIEMGGHARRWIHPNAYIGPECFIGGNTHINYGVTMTRTRIGFCTTIGPGVTLGGDITIGDRVFVGAGAVIGVRHPGEYVHIGDDAVIGAGSLVMRDVPPGVKVLGTWA